MAIVKKWKITSIAKNVEKWKPLCMVAGNVNDAAAVKSNLMLLKKLNRELLPLLSFTFLIVSFDAKRFLILMKSNYFFC